MVTGKTGQHPAGGCGRLAASGALAIVLAGLVLGTPWPAGTPSMTAAGAGPDTTPPAPVLGLFALDARDGKVALGWNASAEPDFDRYRVYSSGDFFLTVTDATRIAELDDRTVHNYTVTGLTDGVEYFFAVTAVDTSGNEDRTVVSVSATPTASAVVDTTAPPAISGLAAADGKDGRVNLTWVPADVPDFDHYAVYVTTRRGASVADLSPAVNLSAIAAAQTTLTGLEDGTAYYFAVTAVDRSGNENRSALATVTATPTANGTGQPPVTHAPESTGLDLSPYNPLFAFIIVALVAAGTFMTLQRADGPPERGAPGGRGGAARNEDGPKDQDGTEEEAEKDGNEEE